MSYYCADCRSTFEEPVGRTEYHTGSYEPGEMAYVCPGCGSTDWDEVQICVECQEEFPNWEELTYVVGKGWVCDECL